MKMLKFKCPECGNITNILINQKPMVDVSILGLGDDKFLVHGHDENDYDNQYAYICGDCRKQIEDVEDEYDLAEYLKEHGVEVKTDHPVLGGEGGCHCEVCHCKPRD
jgi:hypothetical protein